VVQRAPLLAVALTACAPEAPPATPNVLVVLIDDVGVDALALYGVNPDAPSTPTLERLAAEGVLFRNAYASPVCSNTRAGLLTGELPIRHGFGDANGMPADPGATLSFDLTLLPEALDVGTDGTYAHAMVGKWHVHDRTIPEADPVVTAHGFDEYRGHPDNLGKRDLPDGNGESPYRYWSWRGDAARIVDGYVTTDEIDDTLRLTRQLPEPWFVYLAPHAAHDPWPPPPPDLNPAGVTASDPAAERYAASLVALDLELGRLLADMRPHVLARTTILLLGDNGTPGDVMGGPFAGRPAKGSVNEGGIHVPMIAWGRDVEGAGREVDDLVSHFDVFATVLDLAEADYPPPTSSVSFAGALRGADGPPARSVVYQERFEPSFALPAERTHRYRAARGARYKLIRYDAQPDYLVDLRTDPTEASNLLDGPVTADAAAAHQALLDVFAGVDADDDAPWAR